MAQVCGLELCATSLQALPDFWKCMTQQLTTTSLPSIQTCILTVPLFVGQVGSQRSWRLVSFSPTVSRHRKHSCLNYFTVAL
mmetsp:Transcript_43006/g.113317  ORF Transcript_43006/g.113317 Transcript_43006/m.113317 type:complete len:82 (-) Transcript_43006:156-401(-)